MEFLVHKKTTIPQAQTANTLNARDWQPLFFFFSAVFPAYGTMFSCFLVLHGLNTATDGTPWKATERIALSALGEEKKKSKQV